MAGQVSFDGFGLPSITRVAYESSSATGTPARPACVTTVSVPTASLRVHTRPAPPKKGFCIRRWKQFANLPVHTFCPIHDFELEPATRVVEEGIVR